MTAPDAFTGALRIAEAFDRDEISYAIGGAIALGVWGVPRGTVDIDINVFAEAKDLDRVIDVLRAVGLVLDTETAKAEALERGMFVGKWDGMRVDVFTPSIEFSYEAERTRARHGAGGTAAWYLSAESVAVFKLLFFRSKDIADLERLVAVAELDAAYVRRWLVDMMGDDDPRVEKWDELVRTFQVVRGE